MEQPTTAFHVSYLAAICPSPGWGEVQAGYILDVAWVCGRSGEEEGCETVTMTLADAEEGNQFLVLTFAAQTSHAEPGWFIGVPYGPLSMPKYTAVNA